MINSKHRPHGSCSANGFNASTLQRLNTVTLRLCLYARYPTQLLLLLSIALFASTALGQSLSLVKKGAGELWIEAATPPGARYILQGSKNLHLWVDLQGEVQGQISFQFDNTGIKHRFFRLMPWTSPAPPIIIMLIGDSTVADFISNNGGHNGWGQGIYGYFKPDARLVNLAMPDYSTKVFLASAEKDKMLVVKPDYVLVQFGLMDSMVVFSDPHGTTLSEYTANLKMIVETIRGFNGIPILITPSTTRLFDHQGKLILQPWVLDYCEVMKRVAAEKQTHLIDLNQLSTDLYNELGESGSAYIAWNNIDWYHFSDLGAQVMAGLVVNALPARLGPYLEETVLNPLPKTLVLDP